MLYEPNTKLSDLTFEDLFYRMKPRIEFHCHNKENLIRGFEFDDLFQELSYKLWKARIPDDIIYFDWRFLKYMDTMFRNCLYDLAKKRIIKKDFKIIHRDLLDICDSMSNLDRFL